jgi:hypothetical protein
VLALIFRLDFCSSVVILIVRVFWARKRIRFFLTTESAEGAEKRDRGVFVLCF